MSETTTETTTVEQACEVMHDAYERAATTTGWETNLASRKQWADVPEANKETMRAAVSALLDWLRDDLTRLGGRKVAFPATLVPEASVIIQKGGGDDQ